MSGLSARLRDATRNLHLEAERSGFVREILKRRASREAYALYLRNLLPAYEALERALSYHAKSPPLSLFSWRNLFRSEAIASDLSALAGPSWATLQHLPQSVAYLSRIQDIEAADPIRLIGHAYVRYVGDLSGGQIVKALLTEHPGLAPDMLCFYDFPGIADAEACKAIFRGSLDHAGQKSGSAEAIVDEALVAFRLNIALSLAVHRSMSSTDQQARMQPASGSTQTERSVLLGKVEAKPKR